MLTGAESDWLSTLILLKFAAIRSTAPTVLLVEGSAMLESIRSTSKFTLHTIQ
jgi:hypothetical protein